MYMYMHVFFLSFSFFFCSGILCVHVQSCVNAMQSYTHIDIHVDIHVYIYMYNIYVHVCMVLNMLVVQYIATHIRTSTASISQHVSTDHPLVSTCKSTPVHIAAFLGADSCYVHVHV